MNSARSSRNRSASEIRCATSASTLKNGLRSRTTPRAPPIAPAAATKKRTCSSSIRAGPPLSLLALAAERCPLHWVGEQHLLREDQVRPGVVGQLVVVAHRDRVERARHLAVAAEDAARHVDLVDRGVALARRDLVVGGVLRGHHADALGRAGGRAQRAADALLEAGVLEAVQLVAAPGARVDGRLVLWVLQRDRPLDQAAEHGLQPAERLAERAVRASQAAGVRAPLHLDHVLRRRPGHVATRIAVTRAFTVASGSRIFQPNAISWS